MYVEPKFADPPCSSSFCEGAPKIACYECKLLHCTFHASILFHLEVCVRLRQASGAQYNTNPAAMDDDAADNTHPGVWICCKCEVQPDRMRPTTPPPPLPQSGVFHHHTPSHPMTFRS